MDPAETGGLPVETVQTDESAGLRWQTADLLLDRSDLIVADVVAVFPYSGPQRLEADYCIHLGSALVRLLADAVRSSTVDSRSGSISDFMALAGQRGLSPEQIFSFGYLTMSTAIDELSLDSQLGATTEPWPQVAQAVRRAVFDVLGAWAARAINFPSAAAITDQLTTLNTRPVLELALFKECHRAERFEHWLSMILLDVDDLAQINRAHGYGVGDRILERLGILLRTYFRQHDLVARYDEDAIAVLLPETSPEDARALADRTRAMVHDRLTFRDYRTEQRASISVSLAVVSARALQGEPIDSQRFLVEAEAVLERAQAAGRNQLEHLQIPPRLMSIDEAARMLKTNLEGIERLVGEGKLEPISAGRHVRLEREAVLQLAAGSRQ